MPQSTDVVANQMEHSPEHNAEAAAASKDHQATLKPHEETVMAENEARRQQSQHADKLHHGKAVDHNE